MVNPNFQIAMKSSSPNVQKCNWAWIQFRPFDQLTALINFSWPEVVMTFIDQLILRTFNFTLQKVVCGRNNMTLLPKLHTALLVKVQSMISLINDFFFNSQSSKLSAEFFFCALKNYKNRWCEFVKKLLKRFTPQIWSNINFLGSVFLIIFFYFKDN